MHTPQDRVQRLKDARTEATKEIDEYRRVKETEFKAFEASVSAACVCISHIRLILQQHAGNISIAQAAVDRETEQKLQATTAAFDANKDNVVRKLLDRVVLIEPELHRNLTKGVGGAEEQ